MRKVPLYIRIVVALSFSPHGQDFKSKTKAMELVSLQAIEALKGFFISLTAAEKSTVSQLAQTVFLRNLLNGSHKLTTSIAIMVRKKMLMSLESSKLKRNKGKILLDSQTRHKVLLETLYSLPSRLLSMVKITNQERRELPVLSKVSSLTRKLFTQRILRSKPMLSVPC